MRRLIENIERAMQIVPVMKDGKETGVFTYQGQVANRALELLGKHVGMWSDKQADQQDRIPNANVSSWL